jgi:bifunctional DNA-binding transcriptional regulator/antitoxin component of YhaV-PrlF toxin-antitoxin module
MATDPVVRPVEKQIVVPADLRELLKLQETDTHYAVHTLSGATLLRSKAEIQYPWQLLEGVLDDGKDTSEERRREREQELSHDQQKFGRKSDD